MAFQAIGLVLVCLIMVLSAEGQYKLPVPYQTQPYPQAYQPIYPTGYQQQQPYQYTQQWPYQQVPIPYQPYQGYQQPNYPILRNPQILTGVRTLPYGYRVEPLSPQERDENDIISGVPYYQTQYQNVIQSQNYQPPPTPQVQPQPESESKPELLQPKQNNQDLTLKMPETRIEYSKPSYTVEIVTSSPAEYVVHEENTNTKYTNNNNNSLVFHKVNNNAFNTTVRKIFTTDGSKSGMKVYTINIVNGVEVTTTEDPNAIGNNNFNGNPSDQTVNNSNGANAVDTELEENNKDDDDDDDDADDNNAEEKKPKATFSWFAL